MTFISCTNLRPDKISDAFKFQQDLTIHFECQKTHIQLWLVHGLCNFYPIFMKLADEQDRYKIFDKLETGPHCNIYICPWSLACWVSGERSLPIGLLILFRIEISVSKQWSGSTLFAFVPLWDAGNKWASSRENRSSGFATRVDSNQPAQPQKLARGLKFLI